MRVFVTGGTGFVGMRAIAKLSESGHEVTALSRQPHNRLDGALPTGCRVVTGNLCDTESFAHELSECEAVLHCARTDFDDPFERAMNDVYASVNLYDLSVKVGLRRFVYLSSISAYQCQPRGDIVETSQRSQKSDPYVLSKVWTERMLLAHHKPSLEVVVLQPGNVYGPGRNWWTSGQLDLMRRGRIVLPARGEGTANLIFVDDLARVIVSALEVPGIDGEAFLVTDDGVCSWYDYYKGLEGVAGRSAVLYVTESECRQLSASLLDGSLGARTRRFISRRVFAKDIVFPLSDDAIERFCSRARFRSGKAVERLSMRPCVELGEGLEAIARGG